MTRPGRRAAAPPIAAVVLALLALTGCSGSGADQTIRGIPDDWEGPMPDPLTDEPSAGWIDDDEFAIITMGSGSCPPVPSAPQVRGSGEVEVEFGPSPNNPCTADMGPTTHVFRLPPAVIDRPVTVTVTYQDYDEVYELELPGS